MLPLAFLNLGPWEIALIVVLALLLFGGKRLPSLAKDLGSGIKEFRKSLSAASEDTEPTQPQNKPETYSAIPEVEKQEKVKKTNNKSKKKA